MEKGLSKHWTPEQENFWASLIRGSHTFAERHIATRLRNLFKYDWRTMQAKRANAQARLQLIVATDADLWELAELEAKFYRTTAPDLSKANKPIAQRFEELKKHRDVLRAKGIKRSDLCAQP